MDGTKCYKPLSFLACSGACFALFCRYCSGFARLSAFLTCQIPKYFRWLHGRPVQGFPAQNFGQHAPREKPEGGCTSEKSVLTLTLSEAELKELRFAAYCQACELQDSHEAEEPEVVAALERLNAILRRLIDLEEGRPS